MAKDRHNPTFTWCDWGIPTTTRVSTVSVPANIRTKVLPHINRELHQFTNLYGNAYSNTFSILDRYNFINHLNGRSLGYMVLVNHLPVRKKASDNTVIDPGVVVHLSRPSYVRDQSSLYCTVGRNCVVYCA
jgi:hypothetical protein